MRSVIMIVFLSVGALMVPQTASAQEEPDDCFECQWDGQQYACVQVEPGEPGQTESWEDCQVVFGHCEVQGNGCGTLDLASALAVSPTGDRSDLDIEQQQTHLVDLALGNGAGSPAGLAQQLVACDGTVLERRYSASVERELRARAEWITL